MRIFDPSSKGRSCRRVAIWSLLALVGSPTAFATTTLFSASLNGAQEVSPNASPAIGLGTVLLDDVAGTITVNETWSGLTAAATASHIHGPAAAGVNGPVLFAFTGVPAATAGSIPQQVFPVTPTQIAQLRGGLFYFNVHTSTFPGGEIRGQIPALPSSCAENFDGVTAPALPAGWVTAATGVMPLWITSTAIPSSAPNAAFAPNTSNTGNSSLDTPDVQITSASAQVTFRNSYNMESTFDGMVLEISIGGGAFQDIVTAGGSFVTGGYNGTISVNFGSPIAGRQAWTGLSGGTTASPAYISTTVNLPASANGQLIRLRWRAASDNSVSAAGQAGVRIDDIRIACSPLTLVSAQSRRVHVGAGTFDLPLSLVATNPTTEPRQGPAHSIIVFTFNQAITGATATVTEGPATAGLPTISGNDVIVALSGVADQQYVTVSLSNVSDATGGTGGSASVRVGFLLGDVNQSRVVTLADLAQVNAQLSQPVTAANYLKDVNASGTLTLADKGITNGNLTKALPPP
jgi:hypothetical protein